MLLQRSCGGSAVSWGARPSEQTDQVTHRRRRRIHTDSARPRAPASHVEEAAAVLLDLARCDARQCHGVAGITILRLGTTISAGAVDLAAGEDAPPPPAIGPYSGGFNILVVGADNSADQGDQYGERTATLNDVNIVLHVSDDHSSAVAVSFQRDLVIPHPSCEDPEDGEVLLRHVRPAAQRSV